MSASPSFFRYLKPSVNVTISVEFQFVIGFYIFITLIKMVNKFTLNLIIIESDLGDFSYMDVPWWCIQGLASALRS